MLILLLMCPLSLILRKYNNKYLFFYDFCSLLEKIATQTAPLTGTSHTDHMAYTDGVRCICIQTHTERIMQEPSSQEHIHFVEVWHNKITNLHK